MPSLQLTSPCAQQLSHRAQGQSLAGGTGGPWLFPVPQCEVASLQGGGWHAGGGRAENPAEPSLGRGFGARPTLPTSGPESWEGSPT